MQTQNTHRYTHKSPSKKNEENKREKKRRKNRTKTKPSQTFCSNDKTAIMLALFLLDCLNSSKISHSVKYSEWIFYLDALLCDQCSSSFVIRMLHEMFYLFVVSSLCLWVSMNVCAFFTHPLSLSHSLPLFVLIWFDWCMFFYCHIKIQLKLSQTITLCTHFHRKLSIHKFIILLMMAWSNIQHYNEVSHVEFIYVCVAFSHHITSIQLIAHIVSYLQFTHTIDIYIIYTYR